MAFELKSKNENYHILVIKNIFDAYSDIIGSKYYNYYQSDIYSFKDALKIDDIQLIEDKILSYGSKCNKDDHGNIYYYFNDINQGQKLINELNILLKLSGELI